MSDSDSTDSYEGQYDAKQVFSEFKSTKYFNHPEKPYCITKIYVSDEWSHIPLDVKLDSGHYMRLNTYWLPLLLRQDTISEMFVWGASIGLVNADDPTDLNLRTVRKIEALEGILKAIDIGTCTKERTSKFIRINTSFTERMHAAVDEALLWLEKTKIVRIDACIRELSQRRRTTYAVLRHVFKEFVAYIFKMTKDLKKTVEVLKAKSPENIQAASELLKRQGNELFMEENYQEAVNAYTKAINFVPQNHIFFGNRALCYFRWKKYLEAAIDGKRAILIEPLWPKGHYRFCEALFMLGELQWAMCANTAARKVCMNDRDLEQQHEKFVTEMARLKAMPQKKKQSGAGRPRNISSPAESPRKSHHSTKTGPGNRSSRVETTSAKGFDNGSHNKNNDEGNDMNKGAGETSKKHTKPVKEKATHAATKEQLNTGSTNSKEIEDLLKEMVLPNAAESEVQKQITKHHEVFRCLIKDACKALRYQARLEVQNGFKKVFDLQGSSTLQEIGFSLSELEMQLLLYGHVRTLLTIGKPQEVAEVHKVLEKIESYKGKDIQYLVYYTYGILYRDETKYPVALEHFQDSLQMVNKITPRKLTWPLTKEIIKETDWKYFKKILEDCIKSCKYPPRPIAVCRCENCLGSWKNMYITDSEFKGFVQLMCSQKCLIEYHIACWKAFKPASFEKSEKPCLTPDCSGIISCVKIFDQEGEVKHVLNTNQTTPKKAKVNQKPARVKKMKEKKHLKRENDDKQITEKKRSVDVKMQVAKNCTTEQTQQNAWLLYRDRVLLQISQMMQLLRQETGLTVSAVSAGLRPWLELDSARGNHLAGKMLNWEEERLETLEQAVELLLERKNRVWARVFIHLLSNTLDVNLELSQWAGRLNDADLKAAKSFVERNTDHLDELDLTPLLTFVPLKEMTCPNLFSSNELIDFVKQAPPHEMRLFIWTLEEHRDVYVSSNVLLDEYFDMIDGHCAVLKKSNQNNFPASVRNRGRKKKSKESKGVVVWPGIQNSAEEEWDQEDPIYFLDPSEPFRIPRYLQAQVANFEDQYNRTNHTNFKKFLDNNPDPTEENLYDYFAQILEEHGPLLVDDPLLHGEIENFPLVALTKIQKAGGVERFLEESLRFINIGGRIGLAKHAVSLQQTISNQHPNSSQVFTSRNLNNVEPYKRLHMDGAPPPFDYSVIHSRTGQVDHSDDVSVSPDDYSLFDLYASGVDESWETFSCSSVLSSTLEDGLLKKDAEVQASQATSVAVNTEPLQPYEKSQGDINKKVKSISVMEEHIRQIEKESEGVDQKHQETLASLDKEIQDISTNIKVTEKELTLFQQKLEEEVKKDQKEKKANQDELKALKTEMEKLVEEQASLTKKIRASKDDYEEKLNEFLDLSNCSAAEKMSLEDEIKRYKNSIAATTKRSHAAQLSMLETIRDKRLYGLQAQLADVKILCAKLDENVQRFPHLEAERQNVRRHILGLEQKIAAVEIQHREQLEQVKSGKRVSDLLSINQTDTRVSPVCTGIASMSIEPPPQSTAEPVVPPAAETRNPAMNTMFEKAIERLVAMFPDYTRCDLIRFFKELRVSNGGNLNSMSLQDVVNSVSQLILDRQVKHFKLSHHGFTRLTWTASPQGAAAMAGPTPDLDCPPVWRQLGYQRPPRPSALNLEDPCVICQEDMSPYDLCVLECRHTFHKQCIAAWLKEQSTCPTCRERALLPDEFPALPGRRYQAS
ncbi:E3 ubiquitin-protein ligase TTC3 isoform X1 [Corythoichthys intestinalis]|uniref:E3 ubiquitin-protein ligase TTC3 isoform X1 n=2 Tax=Corythoichthys intestinalis TaxID=161448 RepID=UPI0025A590A2|nr:E3 ubiquitin-protein ligase TTC3 isoform X1 [Corythoichthys intestinalis]XP_057676907.1 E3 ubiquitin-protein ligase TTC3 isoform X1 [Corythoichthys intestinalis]